MDINSLVNVTSRSWALTILKLIHSGVPARQAPLLTASGASRTSFANSLAHLVELGLLERNPGHGHPLRPEYRMTLQGIKFAEVAAEIAEVIADAQQPVLLRRVWTIPVLAVSRKPRRFIEIKQDLGSITDRALSQSLQCLEAQRWIERKIDADAHPIRPMYQAVNEGAGISAAVGHGI